MVKVNDRVIFVDGNKQEQRAVVTQVWTDKCVNLLVNDGSQPTSVLHQSYFSGQTPTGHFWYEDKPDIDA